MSRQSAAAINHVLTAYAQGFANDLLAQQAVELAGGAPWDTGLELDGELWDAPRKIIGVHIRR